MKKMILGSAIVVSLMNGAYAEDTSTTTTVQTPTTSEQTTPSQTTVTTTIKSEASTASTSTTNTNTMNCDYKIPAKTMVEKPMVAAWAKNAITQTFTFSAPTLETQLSALKNCFTDQGWQGFNVALQKSGNLDAIKSQQLMVSSLLQGEPVFIEEKDNQWRVSAPIQVVYQNTKEKITQKLEVTLLIARKPSGDLGIVQMIAEPEKPAAAATPATPVTEKETTTTTTTTSEPAAVTAP